MDILSAFGSLVVTEGASAPLIVSHQLPAKTPEVPPRVDYGAHEQQAVDAVFSHENTVSTRSPMATFLLTAGATLALKEVVLDGRSHLEEENDEKEKETP